MKTISGESVSVAYVSGLVNLFGETDSSIIDFTLTGSTGTLFNNVQFYFDTKETGNYIIANFYKTNVVTGRLYSGLDIGYVTGYEPSLSGDFNLLNSIISGYFSYNSGGSLYTILSPNTEVRITQLGITGNQFLFARSGGATAYSNGSLLGNKFLIVNDVLPSTGDYRIIMSYKNFVPKIRSAGIEFSDLEYIGCEKDSAFVFKIKKVGNYSYFRSSGTITAKFLGPNYPVLSDGILQSGVRWDWSLDTFEYEKTYGFNIYPNNRYQTSFKGEMSLETEGNLIQGSPFIELLKLDNSSKATFLITDDDKEECCGGTCVATIDGKNDFILPTNNSELGQDFKKVEIIPDDTVCGSLGGGSGGSGGSSGSSGSGADGDPDGDPGGSSAGGSSVGSNPPPSSLGSVSTSSSSADTDCCETDLGAQVNIGKLICYKTEYGLMVSLCNSAQCETTSNLEHTVNGRDMGNGSFNNRCASSPLEFKFSIPIGGSIEYVGVVAGRVWACEDSGETESLIRRSNLTSQNTATWTNNTKCECCKAHNFEEEDSDECPEGQTLKAVGQFQCPEGQRTCYKCGEDSGSGPVLLMAMDEMLSILDLLDDI